MSADKPPWTWRVTNPRDSAVHQPACNVFCDEHGHWLLPANSPGGPSHQDDQRAATNCDNPAGAS